MGAYFVRCTGFDTDAEGNVTCVHCTYDPATKGGECADRKVKGTIHWVNAATAVPATIRLYENLVDEEKGVYDEETGKVNVNPNSLVIREGFVEPSVAGAVAFDTFQFLRNGYFCVDCKDSTPEKLVFNRVCSMKSSYKPA